MQHCYIFHYVHINYCFNINYWLFIFSNQSIIQRKESGCCKFIDNVQIFEDSSRVINSENRTNNPDIQTYTVA